MVSWGVLLVMPELGELRRDWVEYDSDLSRNRLEHHWVARVLESVPLEGLNQASAKWTNSRGEQLSAATPGKNPVAIT